ncbi:MAG: efflux RND transporter periplasmic adaptor subunit [Pseudomarimonas sp.]
MSIYPFGRNTLRTVQWAVLLATAGMLIACSDGGGGGDQQFPPSEVSVATPVQKSVTEWDEYSGRIEAIDSVEIRPRVGGYLQSVDFAEGTTVAKGDLLFTIDDREFRAAVASARADVARAASRMQLAKDELARSDKLIAAKAVSQGELEGRRGELKQAEADHLAARARLEQAELSLSYTRITAPIAGRIGAELISAGNLVAPDTTLLTTLVSLDPVYVGFDGDENAYLRYQGMIRRGEWESPREHSTAVEVGLSSDEGYPYKGEIVFIDNALNPATGTIRARALLANPKGVFTPGLFARVRLLGATREDALLIHEQALVTDQDRRYVYVIGEGNAAQRRDIKLGPLVDGLRVVESGLDVNDQVIVNGTRKIFFPGQPVVPVMVPMDQPNFAPPAATPAASAPSQG